MSQFKAGIGVGNSMHIAFASLAALAAPSAAPFLGIALLWVGVSILRFKKPWKATGNILVFGRQMLTPVLAIVAGLFWTFGIVLIPQFAENIQNVAGILLAISLIDSTGTLRRKSK